MSTIKEPLQKLEEFNPKVARSLREITDVGLTCRSLLHHFITHAEEINSTTVIKIQAVLDYMYEKVNIGNWREVPPFVRKTITIASYLRLWAHLKCSDELTDDVIRKSFKIIDFGIMFGCPLDAAPNIMQNCASLLTPSPQPSSGAELPSTRLEESSISENVAHRNTTIIKVIDCPSMENFYQNYITAEQPIILDNCMTHWPALTKWRDQEYFIQLAGLRTVSVEIGSKYTDSDWTQKLMTIEDFIKGYIYETDGQKGYLAQYQLFDQIPELREDIAEPEYCCFSHNDSLVDVNAWYGPKGTVSPLHHDPKRNLLAQVVGEKQLYLFSPSDSEHLYPHEHELLNNTAQVDPRQPDLEKYPKYKDAKPYYCMLKPGQMLYIPPKWWHFVESLSISFSVSFWWE